MYHEVYTPERTHSGISLFGLFLQVYTHRDLGGITQSVPTNHNSHSLIYSMSPARWSSGWKKKTNITHEKRREVCRLKLYWNSSTAVCVGSPVSSVHRCQRECWEAQGKCLHHLVSLWYSQINRSKNMSCISGVCLISRNSVTWW